MTFFHFRRDKRRIYPCQQQDFVRPPGEQISFLLGSSKRNPLLQISFPLLQTRMEGQLSWVLANDKSFEGIKDIAANNFNNSLMPQGLLEGPILFYLDISLNTAKR